MPELTRRPGAARRGHEPSRLAPPHAWNEARGAASSLSVLRGVLGDPAGRAWRRVVDAVAGASTDLAAVAAAYARLFSLLAREVEFCTGPLVGDAWQHHLLSRLLDDENPFSLKAERVGWDAIGPALIAQTRADLAAVERCYRLTGTALASTVSRIAGLAATPWDEFRPLAGESSTAERLAVMRRFHGERGWDRLARELAAYFATHGAGMFGRFRAFRWTRASGHGRLEGITHVDPIRLDDLIGYELERQPVLENTHRRLLVDGVRPSRLAGPTRGSSLGGPHEFRLAGVFRNPAHSHPGGPRVQ